VMVAFIRGVISGTRSWTWLVTYLSGHGAFTGSTLMIRRMVGKTLEVKLAVWCVARPAATMLGAYAALTAGTITRITTGATGVFGL
jgi:hypothetical protein